MKLDGVLSAHVFKSATHWRRRAEEVRTIAEGVGKPRPRRSCSESRTTMTVSQRMRAKTRLWMQPMMMSPNYSCGQSYSFGNGRAGSQRPRHTLVLKNWISEKGRRGPDAPHVALLAALLLFCLAGLCTVVSLVARDPTAISPASGDDREPSRGQPVGMGSPPGGGQFAPRHGAQQRLVAGDGA
jgi:hypothetical protein